MSPLLMDNYYIINHMKNTIIDYKLLMMKKVFSIFAMSLFYRSKPSIQVKFSSRCVELHVLSDLLMFCFIVHNSKWNQRTKPPMDN